MSKYARQLLFACFTFSFAFNIHAQTVIKNLNGIDYEWVHLSETRGITSSDMKLRLADPNDPFYGYEYASRALIGDLLLSYAPWDGLDGVHSNSAVTTGISQFSSDFQPYAYSHPNPDPTVPMPTVDGGDVFVDTFSQFGGIYGSPGECGTDGFGMCKASFDSLYFQSGIVAATQKSQSGWNSADPNPFHESDPYGNPYVGSFLVREVYSPFIIIIWMIISIILIAIITFMIKKKYRKHRKPG